MEQQQAAKEAQLDAKEAQLAAKEAQQDQWFKYVDIKNDEISEHERRTARLDRDLRGMQQRLRHLRNYYIHGDAENDDPAPSDQNEDEHQQEQEQHQQPSPSVEIIG